MLEKFKVFMALQQNEVNLHWTRNNYFLLISSILLVALSQEKIKAIDIMIAISGLSLNAVWLLIQDRSNRYVNHWNHIMYDYAEKANLPKIYPEGRKIPIRILAQILPVPFLLLWVAVIVLLV